MDTLRLLSRSSGLKLNKGQQLKNQPLPSAGGHSTQETHSNDNSTIKKRKRDVSEQSESVFTDLDEAQIRRAQKQHKIKITNLHALHHEPSRSKGSESRKAHKEAARVFPQPLQAFAQLRELDVHRALVENLANEAYREPTEVQFATVPLLLNTGDAEPDLLTVAPTGSGKTLAFLIPLIDHIAKRHHEAEEVTRHVSALILAPTKELVSQIVNEGRKLASGTGVSITEMRKGMRLAQSDDSHHSRQEDEQDSDASEGAAEKTVKGTVVKVDILVSTPLSILNAITRSDSTIMPLEHIRWLILDEADYLLDPLFRDQVVSIWSACTSPSLRSSLWSATIGSSIEELAVSIIRARYPVRARKTRPLLRTIVGLKDTSLPTITHKLVYASTETGKLMGLRQLLHPAPSSAKGTPSSMPVLRPPFLIFTQTISRATSLCNELKYDIPASAGGATRIAVLHSDLSSTQRAKTMTEFRQGKVWILITTDLLSRGMDFRGINGVVNYDIPTTAASYVHRAGRTGRAGREGGVCVTFYTREDIKYLKPIANLISASETQSATGKEDDGSGMPAWLMAALPELSKQDRQELKQRGVDVRRAVKESDDKEARREKGKNRIGTSSGYERRLQDKKRGMIEGSRRRKHNQNQRDRDDNDVSDEEDASFEGFGS